MFSDKAQMDGSGRMILNIPRRVLSLLVYACIPPHTRHQELYTVQGAGKKLGRYSGLTTYFLPYR